MATELNLRFPDADHLVVSYDGEESGALGFANPLTDRDRQDLRWYLEVYGAHSLGDPDDGEARRIAARLPVLGKALFDAALDDRAAQRLFVSFQDATDEARLLTISAECPSVLGLPWELLHDSARGGVFLFNERPRISIRRHVTGARGGRGASKVKGKDRLHLLFVVSRPAGTGFLDPRADAAAVLDALEAHAPGRCSWEFLRPPTLDALVARLDDDRLPPVDILHFDGHGVFDTAGGLPERLDSRGVALPLSQPLGGEKLRGTPVTPPTPPLTTPLAPPAAAPSSPPNTGYLLFETADGEPDLVGAERLGLNLHRRNVPLVILSSCQSAAHGSDGEPLGSVAARLTAAGIPAVLAMTYSVLVPTTRALFGEFYKQLSQHRAIGEALDAARLHLYNHPEKYEVQRGAERVPLALHDWFVPALYQHGADVPLMRAAPADATPADAAAAPAAAPRSNVPALPEAGFHGRKRELWDVERWLAGRTRRVTISGFGGQGKTALAHEAARWLVRIGQFEAAVFVDYSRVQVADAVPVAVSHVGSVLGVSLLDAAAAREALRRTPTLVILDNLETVAEGPLHELLDAAREWSEAGGSRVLLTTRAPELRHPDYRNEGTLLHRRIVLAGLGSRLSPDAALEWFAELRKLPPPPGVPVPAREALVGLFDLVRFHPLSLRVLAQQLKTRRATELGPRLEQLLAARATDGGAATTEATLPELVASVQLSLDRLDDAARAVLPRLGVFQGGAFEDDLQAVTGLGDFHQRRREELQALSRDLERGDPRAVLRLAGAEVAADAEVPAELLARISAEHFAVASARVRDQLAELGPPPASDLWPGLRRQLEAAALVEAESIPGIAVPYLRFHPTLAPMLWAQLDDDERARLALAHRQRYHALARYLFDEDGQQPHFARAIAQRDLPNLLHAAHRTVAARDQSAVDLTYRLTRFLTLFGLTREAERLTTATRSIVDEEEPDAHYISRIQQGERLMNAGRPGEAAELYAAILRELGDAPGYRRGAVLANLGRCMAELGQLGQAVVVLREGKAVVEALERSDPVRRLQSVLHTELADALRGQGEYADARQEYLAALRIDEELGQVRDQGVSHGQLGALALVEGQLQEALARYRAALELFQQLGEPGSEATAWHQLGCVYQAAEEWEEAERHFREAARLKETHGDPVGAAKSWNHLGLVSQAAGKPEAAETWLHRALAAFRTVDDQVSVSKCLSNLGLLLRDQPGRLPEARRLLEEGLAIDRTLDPAASEIWKTHQLLEGIAQREAGATTDPARLAALHAEAREHRRLARETKRDFAGTRHELQKHAPLIITAVAAIHHRLRLAQLLADREQRGWGKLVAAIRRIDEGERDADALCDDLDMEDSAIVEAMLQAIADPDALADLMPAEDQASG